MSIFHRSSRISHRRTDYIRCHRNTELQRIHRILRIRHRIRRLHSQSSARTRRTAHRQHNFHIFRCKPHRLRSIPSIRFRSSRHNPRSFYNIRSWSSNCPLRRRNQSIFRTLCKAHPRHSLDSLCPVASMIISESSTISLLPLLSLKIALQDSQ